jgi:hypothetical protein
MYMATATDTAAISNYIKQLNQAIHTDFAGIQPHTQGNIRTFYTYGEQ